MTPRNLLTEWARLLLGSLRTAGLRQVVVSPGSRSTPFTWAALHDPALRCRVIIDERSAAFFALGHARMTGEPALLICTSGSAAANYFPALVEAAESHTPMLVLTADRPLELQQAAAPQTIDQVKLYGEYARAFFDLGTPDADPRMLRAIPRVAGQAWTTARGPVPGPVQINARARKPLEPWLGRGAAEDELRAVVDRLIRATPRAEPPEVRPSSTSVAALVEATRAAQRGLIVCGPAAPHCAATPAAIADLARATGFPVIAESASQLRFTSTDDTPMVDAWTELLALVGFRAAHAPDLVIQVGRPPTASAWHTAMDEWTETRRWVLAPHGWPDPSSTATGLVRAPLEDAVRVLTEALREVGSGGPGERDGGRRSWQDTLLDAGGRARGAIDASLEGAFTEGAAVRAVVDRLQPGSVLALGNSLPIREVDTFVPPGDRGLTVAFQRGANGIDGLISGAAGATAASARPTTLLLGDVSFVHDLGGLRTLRDLPAPLTVVVLNNGGGRIFERLPLAERLEEAAVRDAWLTPPDVDMAAAAAAFGVAYARATDPAGLGTALDEIGPAGGVVEVIIPPEGTTAHQRDLRGRIEAALAR